MRTPSGSDFGSRRIISADASVMRSTNNAQLSSLEQDVLWEYAKLGDKIKRVNPRFSETPIGAKMRLTDDQPRSSDIRVAERAVTGRTADAGEKDGPRPHPGTSAYLVNGVDI